MVLTMQTANRSIYCSAQYKYVSLLRCTICKHYPCEKITEDIQQELLHSDYVKIDSVTWRPRRAKMFIGKLASGALEVLRDNFSTENATPEEIMKYSEVLYVSKVFVPEMRLVPKSKQERSASSSNTPTEEVAAQKQRRGRKPA